MILCHFIHDSNHLTFYCPGCKYYHKIAAKLGVTQPNENGLWGWNGSFESPTFIPSVLVWENHTEYRCHFYVRDGVIEFLNDCHHELKGQKVPMQPI